MHAEVTVTVHNDNGTVVSRTVRHERVNYPVRETMAQFRANVRRRATEALGTVLGR